MWEWSNKFLKKKEKPQTTSLLSAYDDLLHQQTKIIKSNPSSQPLQKKEKSNDLSIDEMKTKLEEKLENFGLKNIQLRLTTYDPQTWQEMNKYHDEFKRARSAFLKLLGYSHTEECLKNGLNKEDIALLKNSLTPENYNVHIKIPFDFGGGVDFPNLCFIKTHNTHNKLHELIDMQIENGFLQNHKKIYIPHFEGRFYHD